MARLKRFLRSESLRQFNPSVFQLTLFTKVYLLTFMRNRRLHLHSTSVSQAPQVCWERNRLTIAQSVLIFVILFARCMHNSDSVEQVAFNTRLSYMLSCCKFRIYFVSLKTVYQILNLDKKHIHKHYSTAWRLHSETLIGFFYVNLVQNSL